MRATPHRRRITNYLFMWRRLDNNDLLACAAIIANIREEHEFFTWAIEWLTKR